ncbi:MAG: hypothetical protein U0984_03710, partial [Prosthecobacter sp.]|nr:hypothetical protein [Prosthecobacter sp.]
MKKNFFYLLTTFPLFLTTALSTAQQPGLVRVSAVTVKAPEAFKQANTEFWAYKITLENTSAQKLTDLEVRCRIYVRNLNPGLKSASPLTYHEE